jgi:zinc protease
MRAGVRCLVAVAVFISTGCGGGGGDSLPGHSRPILEHDWADPSELSFAAIGFAPPDPTAAQFEAPSGLRAYIVTDPSEPLVRLSAAIPLGRLREGTGEAGASALLTRLLTTRGAAGATRPLTLSLAELGTTLSVEETLDVTKISLDVLPEDWRTGLELLVQLLRNPDLDASAVHQYRVGEGYSMPMSGTGGSGFRPKVELERAVAGYPLAPPDPGTTVSLVAIRDLASRSLAADRVVLGVGGAVSRSDVEDAIESLSDGWSTGTAPVLGLNSIEPNGDEGRFHAIDVPSLEGWIAIGKVVGTVPSADQATLAVLRFILSERLNIAAREMRGLANRDEFEIPVTGSGTGLLTVRTGGRPEAVAPLVRFSLDEIERLHDPSAPVTDVEVERAQGWLVNAVWQPTLGLATSASVAIAVEHVRRGGTDRLMGWPRAVRAVTAADVKALAERYLDPETLVTVVVGPLARIREARHPRWPIGLDEVAASLTGGN